MLPRRFAASSSRSSTAVPTTPLTTSLPACPWQSSKRRNRSARGSLKSCTTGRPRRCPTRSSRRRSLSAPSARSPRPHRPSSNSLRDILQRELDTLRGYINQLRPSLNEAEGLDDALRDSAMASASEVAYPWRSRSAHPVRSFVTPRGPSCCASHRSRCATSANTQAQAVRGSPRALSRIREGIANGSWR